MIYEHEIPNGSKLYFGKSAKLKRKIEMVASEILDNNGFEEIVSPYLSYHQHKYINEKHLLRFSDNSNNIIALRGDSTLDVVRIVTKRLGRTTTQKHWFYVQPVFRYPSSEVYQIGGELIEQKDLFVALSLVDKIFKALHVEPILQISNIQIPKILSSMLKLPLDVFKSGNLETLLSQNEAWLTSLATLQNPKDISGVIDVVPDELKNPLKEIKILANSYEGDKIVVAPLFYAKMRYYDNLFFRFIDKNKTLSIGGCYEFDKIHSSGFGLYVDSLIEYLNRKNYE